MEVDYSGQSNRNKGNNADKPLNTGLITEFRRVSQMVQNNVAADKSRKTSRLSKGLNPDVPRPVNQSPGTPTRLFSGSQEREGGGGEEGQREGIRDPENGRAQNPIGGTLLQVRH